MYHNKGLKKQLLFYTAKLPGIFLLVTIGIMMDFIIQLPFLILCTLENRYRRRSG
jgi:hypothetical protein